MVYNLCHAVLDLLVRYNLKFIQEKNAIFSNLLFILKQFNSMFYLLILTGKTSW